MGPVVSDVQQAGRPAMIASEHTIAYRGARAVVAEILRRTCDEHRGYWETWPAGLEARR